MGPEFITVERRGPVTVISLARPEVMNALHRPMQEELGDAFDAFAADPDQWVAVLTGQGERAFCAGSDLKAAAGRTAAEAEAIPWHPSGGYGGLTERFDLDKPVIAAVNGHALGGGFEMALACDLIIAAEHASFGLTEPRVGNMATAGGVHRLARDIGDKRAMGMILTGRRVSAAEGLALGFVNEVVPAGGLMAATRRWADQIAACAPLAVRAAKQAVRLGQGAASLAEAMAAQNGYPGLKAMRASEDSREGPRAFAEKRPPVWTGR